MQAITIRAIPSSLPNSAGRRECRMMLIGKKLRVVLVTGHVGYMEVVALLDG